MAYVLYDLATGRVEAGDGTISARYLPTAPELKRISVTYGLAIASIEWVPSATEKQLRALGETEPLLLIQLQDGTVLTCLADGEVSGVTEGHGGAQ